MNKLGRGSQGDTIYQISNLRHPVSEKRNLKMGFFVPMVQLVIPGAGPVLTQGHHMN